MAVYIVTGKLGSGKTLLACMKAQEYLKRRCPIASNIEFNLEKLCRPTNDYSRFVRLPDMPTADDLTALGMGCDKYDEDRFGAIFLDEAGIWLNSRKWNSSGRIDLLEFFLYLRKRRWDLWLLVQNIDVVDKQIRSAIAEHVVYCSRSDRYQMPFVPKLLLNVITLGLINFVKMPKFHTAVCKYGVSKLAPNADVWYYRGNYFYDAYNTTQQFDSSYSNGIYSVLPPAYTLPIRRLRKDRYVEYLKTLPSHTPRPAQFKKKIMRLTKIYFRKFKVPLAFGSGSFVMFCVLVVFYTFFLKTDDSPIELDQIPSSVSPFLVNSPVSKKNVSFSGIKSLSDTTSEDVSMPSSHFDSDYIRRLKISAFSRYPNGMLFFRFVDSSGSLVSYQELKNDGFYIIKGDRYHVVLQKGDQFFNILRF